MIELYYWPTPNGHKITMLLEEAGLALPDQAGEHRSWRAVRTGVPAHFAEQPHAGPGRYRPAGRRRAAERVRVRRDPRIPGGQDRPLPAADAARALRRARVVVLAGRWARPDARAEPSLQPLRAGKDSLRDRPLRQRDAPPLRRARQAAARARLHRRRRLHHRRHGGLSVDRAARSAGHDRWTISRISRPGSSASATAKPPGAPMRSPTPSRARWIWPPTRRRASTCSDWQRRRPDPTDGGDRASRASTPAPCRAFDQSAKLLRSSSPTSSPRPLSTALAEYSAVCSTWPGSTFGGITSS